MPWRGELKPCHLPVRNTSEASGGRVRHFLETVAALCGHAESEVANVGGKSQESELNDFRGKGQL